MGDWNLGVLVFTALFCFDVVLGLCCFIVSHCFMVCLFVLGCACLGCLAVLEFEFGFWVCYKVEFLLFEFWVVLTSVVLNLVVCGLFP